MLSIIMCWAALIKMNNLLYHKTYKRQINKCKSSYKTNNNRIHNSNNNLKI